MLFTDTDSLIYEIKTEDVHEEFYENKSLFDFSDYPENLKFFDPLSKKVIDKMQDEFKGRVISAFVGLNPKIYSPVTADNEKIGVNKRVVKNIRHREYVNVLFNKKITRHKMKRIQNEFDTIGGYDVCKISLSCFDDKRYVLGDGINNLAYFYKDIKNQQQKKFQ